MPSFCFEKIHGAYRAARVQLHRAFFGAMVFLLLPASLAAQSKSGEQISTSSATKLGAAVASRTNPLTELNNSLETLVARVSPAVVQIIVTGYGPQEDHAQKDVGVFSRQHTLGSGVIVDPTGYIVTNGHVVEGAQRIRVILPTPPIRSTFQVGSQTGKILNATLVGIDSDSDLAVIKVDGSNLPTLELGYTPGVRQGQLVLAIGSPEGLPSSVSMGIVSSPLRQPDHDSPMVFIQTDATINPGNSGGPLVDVNGKLVGINTMILSQGGGSEGLGFAIPVGVVKTVYRSLRKYGHVHRPEIGADFQEITPELAAGLKLSRAWGAITADVTDGGPAQIAGLKVGDIVLSVDGRPIVGVPGCRASLYLHPQEEPLNVVVLRGTQSVSLTIPFVAHHDQFDDLAQYADLDKDLVPKLGVFAVDLDDKMRKLLGGANNQSGVLIVAGAATAGSLNTGLKQGDLVRALNLTPINSLQQLRTIVGTLKPDDPVVLQIERNGKLQYLTLDLDDE